MIAVQPTDSLPRTLHLPDTMTNWPGSRIINPYFEEVKAETVAWFHTFKALNARSQYAFDKGNFTLLAALAYPWASKDHLRTGSDLMHVFFLVDEYTDVESAHAVRDIVAIVLDAMHNPHHPRPEGEIIVGEITRQFWARAIKTASATSQKHMIEDITDYLESVIDQAADRDMNLYRTVEEYLERRRKNVGVRPVFVPMELGLNLTDEVFYHPVVVTLASYIVELVIIDNDIASYNKEQAVGDDRYNLLTLTMRQHDIDFDEAISRLVQYHSHIEAAFMETLNHVPSFGPELDRDLKFYIRGLSNWPRANDCWNFESCRYFGNNGPKYKRTRQVPLLPKAQKYIEKGLHGEDIVVPLVEQLAGNVKDE